MHLTNDILVKVVAFIALLFNFVLYHCLVDNKDPTIKPTT